jgi:hypothetical protein
MKIRTLTDWPGTPKGETLTQNVLDCVYYGDHSDLKMSQRYVEENLGKTVEEVS